MRAKTKPELLKMQTIEQLHTRHNEIVNELMNAEISDFHKLVDQKRAIDMRIHTLENRKPLKKKERYERVEYNC